MPKKCCLNCAYYDRTNPDLGDGFYDSSEWHGFDASCYHKMWTRGFMEAPGEHILERAYHRNQDPKGNDVRKSTDELQEEFGTDFGITKIPMYDGVWRDLASHKCQRFFSKSRQGAMSHEICWQEQQLREENMRYRITRWISIAALVFSVIIPFIIDSWPEIKDAVSRLSEWAVELIREWKSPDDPNRSAT